MIRAVLQSGYYLPLRESPGRANSLRPLCKIPENIPHIAAVADFESAERKASCLDSDERTSSQDELLLLQEVQFEEGFRPERFQAAWPAYDCLPLYRWDL